MELQTTDQAKELISVDEILQIVSDIFNISIDQIKSKSFYRKVTNARVCAVKLIRYYRPDIILKKLGVIIGGRHYSTMIYLTDCCNDLLFSDKPFTALFNQCNVAVKERCAIL